MEQNQNNLTTILPNEEEQGNIGQESLVYLAITKILDKYKLTETDQQLAEKIFGENGGSTNSSVIFEIATDIKNGEKQENELLQILLEKLNFDKNTAEQIMQDIKKDLLPLIKIRQKQTSSSPIDYNSSTSKKSTIENPAEKNLSKLNIEKSLSPSPKQTIQKDSKDKYRESVE